MAYGFFWTIFRKKIVLISKWGCDGSAERSEYKQRSLEDASDNNIFINLYFLFSSIQQKRLVINLFFGKPQGLV